MKEEETEAEMEARHSRELVRPLYWGSIASLSVIGGYVFCKVVFGI